MVRIETYMVEDVASVSVADDTLHDSMRAAFAVADARMSVETNGEQFKMVITGRCVNNVGHTKRTWGAGDD